MELIKNKYFYFGIISGILWTSFSVIVFFLFLSDLPIEKTLVYSYNENKLGEIISLASLINLPIFFISIRLKNLNFASGIVTFLIFIVISIALLKLF
jgi:hypothetical protein